MFASNTSQVSSDATYVEDVFSNFLYTGNGSTQTITNGIDEAGKGALTWIKQRSTAGGHQLYDTARGATQLLSSSNANAQSTFAAGLTSFNANGFSLGNGINCNTSGETYTSWTFRKQPKFFDVVTYTGNGVAGRQISHSLASVPGFIVIKRVDFSGSWPAIHRYDGTNWKQFTLNATDNGFGPPLGTWFGDGTSFVTPTSTNFTVGTNSDVNASGWTYVAYLFAHNAGGFGLTGTDNVISCGSYTGTGASYGPQVDLGFEPQFVMIKAATTTGSWAMFDNMRGIQVSGPDQRLYADTSGAEATTGGNGIEINATGFRANETFSYINGSGQTYIYIAIRRGPMKTPTSGASVFSPQLEGGTAGTQITTNFPIDWQLIKQRSAAQTIYGITRLTGVSTNTTEAAGYLLQTASTAAELADATSTRYWNNTGFQVPSNFSGGTSTAYISENFRRAPGFFDVVCYTGTGAATTQAHNLGVAPELMIVKQRSGANYWPVYSAAIGNDYILSLNTTGAKDGPGAPQWNNTAPTASVFSLGASSGANASGGTYVAYLFASCPGVSKVGSYTGTGATQTISCGFAARFVLIKRTDSTGDWWIWDTARGMVAGTDPRMATNSATAETNANWVYTDASGFQIATTDATVNASGGTYIYLAIA